MVARAMGMDDSTADYHLRGMLKEGRASVERTGRELTWWPPGCAYCPVLRRAIPTLRREGATALLLALDDWPVASNVLAARAGLTVQAARSHLGAFVQAGLAVKTGRGRVGLAEGARTCVQNARAGATCDKWGKCANSRRLGDSMRRSGAEG